MTTRCRQDQAPASWRVLGTLTIAVLLLPACAGRRDALYAGGEGPPFPGTDNTVVHKPVETGLAAWRQVNGCAAAPDTGRTLQGPSTGPNAGQSATELRWEVCTSGAPVVHWKLTGSGHGWPGQTRRVIRESIIGPPTTLIDAAEEAWRFASQFTKPMALRDR